MQLLPSSLAGAGKSLSGFQHRPESPLSWAEKSAAPLISGTARGEDWAQCGPYVGLFKSGAGCGHWDDRRHAGGSTLCSDIRGLGQEAVGVPFGSCNEGVIVSMSCSCMNRQDAALCKVVKMECKTVFLKGNDLGAIPNTEFPRFEFLVQRRQNFFLFMCQDITSDVCGAL